MAEKCELSCSTQAILILGECLLLKVRKELLNLILFQRNKSSQCRALI